jgi:hypothetical protein
MAMVGLTCTFAIAFLLVCLRGFHAALKQKHIVWAVLVVREEADVVEFPRRKSLPVRFSKVA